MKYNRYKPFHNHDYRCGSLSFQWSFTKGNCHCCFIWNGVIVTLSGMVSLLLYLEWWKGICMTAEIVNCCFIWNGGRDLYDGENCTSNCVHVRYKVSVSSWSSTNQLSERLPKFNPENTLSQKQTSAPLSCAWVSIVYNFANGLMVFLQPFPLIPLWFNIIFFSKIVLVNHIILKITLF